MASIDEIFNGAKTSGSKRKNEAIRDPNEIYKAARTGNTTPRHSQADDNDVEAGPALPPGDDEDIGPAIPEDDDDDEEGRFFGGGISKNEQEVLDYVQGDDAPVENIDEPWLRRKVIALEKHINKNAELRARFEGEPQKFISSEADLDADIKALSILAEYPALYTELAKMGSVASLVGLLAHENTDIAIDVLQLLGELTDDEVEATEDQWDALVTPMLDADFLELLQSNLVRFNEDDEADSSGVYHGLWILENLCSGRSTIGERVATHKPLVTYLLTRASKSEPTGVSQNTQYCTEVLAILAQSSKKACTSLVSLNAIDTVLQLVAPYRRKDPAKGSAEEEYLGNLFEILVCLVDGDAGKAKFLEAEGVELCILLISDSKKAKTPALRLLDHATDNKADFKSTTTATQVCMRVVDAAGLKPLFAAFYKTKDRDMLDHLLSLFASMLRLLPLDEAQRIRLLAKWVEKDYQKLGKLIERRQSFARSLAAVDSKHGAVDGKLPSDANETVEDEFLTDQLSAGLFSLHNIDLALAWLVAEDGGVRSKVQREVGYSKILKTLEFLLEGINGESEGDDDTRAMLTTLVSLLK
ncbi:Beta-catenin-like protein 1 [Ceratocystis lukuohia]|uniref:Beta-catenin-like protein 1 n=1 Tax=Ceratocystis lukuohia TaxID=2019550 RepID=A0ABR4MI28_9PEZI